MKGKKPTSSSHPCVKRPKLPKAKEPRLLCITSRSRAMLTFAPFAPRLA